MTLADRIGANARCLKAALEQTGSMPRKMLRSLIEDLDEFAREAERLEEGRAMLAAAVRAQDRA